MRLHTMHARMGDLGGEVMTTLFEVLHRSAEPYKVKLVKGQKNTYGWEITVQAGSYETGNVVVELADRDLKQKFGGGEQKA